MAGMAEAWKLVEQRGLPHAAVVELGNPAFDGAGFCERSAADRRPAHRRHELHARHLVDRAHARPPRRRLRAQAVRSRGAGGARGGAAAPGARLLLHRRRAGAHRRASGGRLRPAHAHGRRGSARAHADRDQDPLSAGARGGAHGRVAVPAGSSVAHRRGRRGDAARPRLPAALQARAGGRALPVHLHRARRRLSIRAAGRAASSNATPPLPTPEPERFREPSRPR